MTSYIGQISMVGFDFAPEGYLICNGQLVSLQQYVALFTLIGTSYGGDGMTTFGLPDLRGRAPIHQGVNAGTTYPLAASGGQEAATVAMQQMPMHQHNIAAFTGASSSPSAGGQTFASDSTTSVYEPVPTSPLASANLLQVTGGGQPHSNIQPSLVINYMICTEGIFPSRN